MSGADFTKVFTKILEQLSSNDKNLTRLELSTTKLSDTQVQDLMLALEGNTQLQDLNLALCGISDIGLGFIIALLLKNHSIVELNLSHNKFSAGSMAGFKEVFKVNNGLKKLWLAANAPDLSVGRDLVNELEHNLSLEAIVIGSGYAKDQDIISKISVINTYRIATVLSWLAFNSNDPDKRLQAKPIIFYKLGKDRRNLLDKEGKPIVSRFIPREIASRILEMYGDVSKIKSFKLS